MSKVRRQNQNPFRGLQASIADDINWKICEDRCEKTLLHKHKMFVLMLRPNPMTQANSFDIKQKKRYKKSPFFVCLLTKRISNIVLFN